MKTYDIALDIKRIRAFFSLTQEEFARAVSSSRISILRYEKSEIFPTKSVIENIYSFAYGDHGKTLNLNESKASLYLDNSGNSKLLFHGAKSEIKSDVDIYHSQFPNDFGAGFYAGETLNQAASWVAANLDSSVYCFYFDGSGLKTMKFNVDRKWMYAILYYRGAFENRNIPKDVKDIITQIDNVDYLIAPIADNQMYQTLNRFINNEITDEACLHALSSTNLGLQYVFKTMKACQRLVCIDRLYLCKQERNDYLSIKEELSAKGQQKANLSIIEYRRKGLYFDELFKGI